MKFLPLPILNLSIFHSQSFFSVAAVVEGESDKDDCDNIVIFGIWCFYYGCRCFSLGLL